MSFLTSQPDLSNTIFDDIDLQRARSFLQAVISQEDPPWLRKPRGILGEYWKRDDAQAACFLIDFARMIYTIDRHVAQKSQPRLQAKVRELLRPPSNRRSNNQFLEVLTELQVAYILVEKVSPLALFASDDFLQPQMSRTPDFGFQTPEGMAFVEVTVFHGGILDAWTQSANYIQTSIQNYLFEQNRMLIVHISLPLSPEIDAQQIVTISMKEMASSDTGSVTIGNKGKLQWEPFPIITLQNNSPLPTEIPFAAGAFRSPGVIIDRAFASQTNIAFSSDKDVQQAYKLVLKGIRTKLREKKGQFPPHNEPEPCLIVMRVEHNRLGEGDIALLLRERIWPNNEYNWLTGIGVYTPNRGFSLADDKAHLELYPNPRSTRPVTASLTGIFNGTATFHYE